MLDRNFVVVLNFLKIKLNKYTLSYPKRYYTLVGREETLKSFFDVSHKLQQTIQPSNYIEKRFILWQLCFLHLIIIWITFAKRTHGIYCFKNVAQFLDSIIFFLTTNKIAEFWIQVMVQTAIRRLKFVTLVTAILASSKITTHLVTVAENGE